MTVNKHDNSSRYHFAKPMNIVIIMNEQATLIKWYSFILCNMFLKSKAHKLKNVKYFEDFLECIDIVIILVHDTGT